MWVHADVRRVQRARETGHIRTSSALYVQYCAETGRNTNLAVILTQTAVCHEGLRIQIQNPAAVSHRVNLNVNSSLYEVTREALLLTGRHFKFDGPHARRLLFRVS